MLTSAQRKAVYSPFWSLLVAAAASFAAPTLAQVVAPESVGLSSERLERIDELVQRNIDQGEITGAVALVARNGKVAYLRAHGVTDIGSKKPMRPDTVFRIASMSKPVAAVAILMLMEEGKVRLQDPVSKFIPAFAAVSVAVPKAIPSGSQAAPAAVPEIHTVPAERPISVLDLLTHTSGVMSGPLSTGGGQAAFRARHEVGLKWVEQIAGSPLEFQPGTRWSYSPVAGFDLLSRIVEIASGQSFDQFLRARIFEPLGMTDVTFWPTAAQRARLVTAYQSRDGQLVANGTPDSMSGERYFSGAGGLMTTAETYARFAMMLANRGALNGRQLLSPRTVELMGSAYIPASLQGRPPGEGYGLGVRVVTDPVARGTWLTAGSFGWSGAYGTHFWSDPKENLVGILLAQTPNRAFQTDFENVVLQSVID